MKIATNKCYGGFGISKKAAERLRQRGIRVTLSGEYYSDGSGPCTSDDHLYLDNKLFGIKSDNYNEYRSNPILIEVIEEIGEEESSGKLARIRIIEILDGVEWELDDYDGIETVHEKHRSW